MKRVFDLVASTIGLALLFPVFLSISVAIKLDSAGPVFFRQERVGLKGDTFRIYKFRSMFADSENHGPDLTAGDDPRVTRVGRFLRKYKLDELPQLLNVFLGEMSLVGPRPEVPNYIALYPKDARDIVLSVRPGITDRASIEYVDESEILGAARDPQRAYIEHVLPSKIRIYTDYVINRSFWGDIRIILNTLIALFR